MFLISDVPQDSEIKQLVKGQVLRFGSQPEVPAKLVPDSGAYYARVFAWHLFFLLSGVVYTIIHSLSTVVIKFLSHLNCYQEGLSILFLLSHL